MVLAALRLTSHELPERLRFGPLVRCLGVWICNDTPDHLDEPGDECTVLRIPSPRNANSPRCFLHVQFMKAHSRNSDTHCRTRDNRNTQTRANQIQNRKYYPDVELALAEAQDGSRQDFGNGSDSESDPQPTGLAFDCRPCRRQCRFRFRQQLRGFRQQHPPCFCQSDFAPGAGKQWPLDLFLESSNFLAQCGLRQKELLGSLAKMKLTSKNQKRMQFRQFEIHDDKLSQSDY